MSSPSWFNGKASSSRRKLVYGSQNGEASENFALSFIAMESGKSPFIPISSHEDVLFFFDALSGTRQDTGRHGGRRHRDPPLEKNLPTLTIVTADEVMKISEIDNVLLPKGKPL